VDPISATLPTQPTTGAAAANSFADLGSEDFLRLLIMQLRNQDPLEPLGNEELLRQISSVREIELSTTLTDSLRTLTGQQRFASASSFIGQYVTGLPGPDGVADSGTVVGVRFTDSGHALLQLAGGSELPLEQVSTVQPPLRAAEALIGQVVIGIDHRDPSNLRVVQGAVTGAYADALGEVVLELDTGEDLRFRDLISVAASEAA
jgi:flagellar basal-body rod modification protein FlgD